MIYNLIACFIFFCVQHNPDGVLVRKIVGNYNINRISDYIVCDLQAVENQQYRMVTKCRYKNCIKNCAFHIESLCYKMENLNRKISEEGENVERNFILPTFCTSGPPVLCFKTPYDSC